MKTLIAIALVLLLWIAAPAQAHQLDEYLQASTLSLQKNRVALCLRLTPGVAVAQKVLARIDADANGLLSPDEQQAYAQQVAANLALHVDNRPVPLVLVDCTYPPVEEIRQGLGEIVLNFSADLPTAAAAHTLTFENHHEPANAAYLVNALVPRDPDIHLLSQERNVDQSCYQLHFTAGSALQPAPSAPPATLHQWLDQTGHLAVLISYCFHGIHHILTGYDHLLFVSALVLAATSLWDLIKVVTAFTLAHSITLTLAALNLVHLPAAIVEPLIAASIVFVALQNILWPHRSRGRARLAAAFIFGLFHGLGFASGLLDLMHQMPPATALLAILGFSIGVEIGHQLVLLPLFACLKALRSIHPHLTLRTPFPRAFALPQLASAAILLAGLYYLGVALTETA